MSSADYRTRALVFGNESARISGRVDVNQDGSKTFKGIEIRPLDTDFNFDHKTWNPALEIAREAARRKFDPESRGISYQIPFRGTERIYDPFTDLQVERGCSSGVQDYPGSGPPGLLPSVTTAPTPGINEYIRYLNQVNDKPQVSTFDPAVQACSAAACTKTIQIPQETAASKTGSLH